ILVSAPIILVIASGFGQFQLMILMLNMIVLSMLLRWQVAVVMIALYCFIGAEYYKWFTGESIGEVLGISLQFKMMYILLMFSSVLIGFLKPQQEHEEFLGEKIDYMDHKLTDQKDELTKAHMAKNEFLRNMEHEAHTPITGITSMGQVLYESYDKFSSAQIKDGLKDIAQSSERLRSLVDNLIDLSKLSCMTVCVEKTKINLSVLLLSRLEICQKIYTKDKPLEFDVTKIDPKVILDADEYYMRSLFDNLIANAMQYTKQGKIELTLRYVKKPNSSKNVIEFTIKDEGIGIPITELYDIFNPFTTSSKTRSNAGGRGIGLALAKKIVEAHNGKIWAESDGTKGSVFKFTIDAVT
ncbi:MAG: HAMP domain-containing sensor histidine kinase, partial [Pseudomonadota bacterium]